jgi:hypothetical protein
VNLARSLGVTRRPRPRFLPIARPTSPSRFRAGTDELVTAPVRTDRTFLTNLASTPIPQEGNLKDYGQPTPGEAFRDSVLSEFDSSSPADSALLDAACSTLDLIARLETRVEDDGLMITGSKDQLVVHPAVAELRQQRAALARLLSVLGLDGGDNPQTHSQRQRAAANARYRKGAK